MEINAKNIVILIWIVTSGIVKVVFQALPLIPFAVLFVATVFFPGSVFTTSLINWGFVISVLMFVAFWPLALLVALLRR